MALTYKLRTVRQETREVELSAPTDWSMYTPAGNRRLTGYAETVIRKMEKADDPSKVVHAQVESFYRKVRKLYDDDRFSEAGDTAVREVVRGFGKRCFLAAGFDSFEADDKEEQLWEGSY
jgi:hypothetical protein